MNGLELFLLGRKLAKLGLEAIPPSGFHKLPPTAQAVLVDVFEHPGTSIGEIVQRTQLPQSQISAAVARFREVKVFSTSPDPADRRRTLVQEAPGVADKARARTSVPIDETIAGALASGGPGEVAEIVSSLELLAARLMPEALSWSQDEGTIK